MSRKPVTYSALLLLVAGCSDDSMPQPGADDGAYRPLRAQREPPVAGHAFAPVAVVPEATGTPFHAPAPIWPPPALAEVVLHGAAAAQLGPPQPIEVAGMPLRIEAAGVPSEPRTLQIESFSRAAALSAGVDGVLLRVSSTAGVATATPARLTLDYGGFRSAYGGGWAARLAMWALPECALTSPGAPGCEARKLESVNDASTGTISAVVELGDAATSPPSARPGATAGAAPAAGMLVMLSATASGAGGDYTATSLSPSATWAASGNSGDFSWSYAMRVPPSLGGPAPRIALDYSSSSVDGRMVSTNNQASWVGEGFEWQPGSIERRYRGCADDMDAGANNTVKTGDLCWETDNASLTLSGHAGELLKDSSNPNLWHLRQDDGTRIEHRTGGPNGDNNGEWWVATTTDGTQYWFGGRSGSSATLTVPVFGNHSGEPCHQTAFKDSSCTQGYRWMLDYVVDPNGNTMSFTYTKETNKYGKNNNPADDAIYDRDGYVAKIEYGTRTDSSGPAPMQVVFEVADRCLSGCTTRNAQTWPDTPWDRECTAATCSPSQISPSFWTTKRLRSVTTQVWNGASYSAVESWTLTHSFPSSDQPTLWLDRISHSGLAGGTLALPDVTLVGVALPNRVDTNNDQYPAMMRYRLKTINSETGGKLDISYSPADCVRGSRVPDQTALQNNELRCFPVKWTPEGLTSPINDFFHKYLVTDIAEADLAGSSARVLTHYDYLGPPAWHYTDDDGFIKKELKTWSVWRGYAAVRTSKGDPGEQTCDERRYFRGMHGDKLPSGTRTVTLPAIAVGNVPAVNDEDAFSGQLREMITFNGPGGGEVSATANEPWQSAPTASRTINGSTVYARFTNTAVVHGRTALDGSRGYRTTASLTAFDAYGMPVQVDDRGDEAVSGDESCTMTDYVRNTTAWIVEKPSRQRKFAVSCTAVQAGGLTDDDVIDDTRSSYDGLAWNVAPGQGNVTRVDTILAYNGGDPSFITQHIAVYDSYGRTLESTDVRGNKTTTSYQPATGGPVTSTTETTQLGWVTTTALAPAWGLPVSKVDSNGRRTDIDYDPLGRSTAVWRPGRDRASESPSLRYSYLIRNDAPSVITSERLNPAGGYVTSYRLLDNLLRDRQAQVPDEAGGSGALVTDHYYDSAGREVKIHDRYLAVNASLQPVAPSTTLFVPTQNIPRFTVKQYDGAGREIASIAKIDGPPASSGGTEQWRTTTAYGGDRTDVTPPAGGTPTSSVLDARGNTIELRHYQPGHPAGSSTGYDRTVFAYNRKNKLATVTDAAGNHWSYSYDLLGRRIREHDPDKGVTTSTYTSAGDLETSTDGRGVAIAFTYDSLGRKTSLRDGSVTGAKRAEWMYDMLPNGTAMRGQLIKSIRYEGTDQYSKAILGFTADYQPTSASFTIPNSPTASGVDGTFTYVYTYHPDSSLATTRLPALGDLALETLTHGYNLLGKPDTLSTTLGATLVAAPTASIPGTEYTSLGELAVVHLRYNSGPRADIARVYDTATRRLAQWWTTRATTPTTVADVRYSYDAFGNILKMSDLTASDHQCFQVDYLRRLQEAWTPADGNCDVAASAAGLGGPARYWHSYSYDALGNRTLLREHATSNGDRDTTYTVPDGAHRLTGATTVDASGTTARAYTYDASGNMLTRPAAPASVQTMTWDAEGRLATSQDAIGTTSYIYDADGNRLVRKDPTGTTLYLPGQELRYTAADGAKRATRYYVHAQQLIATRTGAAGVVWLSGDHHGTAQIAITAVDQTASIRRETPFGGLRGTTGSWPVAMDKGFVGGTLEPTGLTHLGARDYDLALGRFISVDPVFDDNDPQSWTGFAYSDNNPVTLSDPEGTYACGNAASCLGFVGGLLLGIRPTSPPSPGRPGTPSPMPGPRPGGTSGSGSCAGCVSGHGPTLQPAAGHGPTLQPAAGHGPTLQPAMMVPNQNKGSFLGLRMVGVCPLAGGLSALIGVTGSFCIGVDHKGLGTFETGGVSAGAQGGGFLGMSLVGSTGDLDAQRGKFDFWEGSGGEGVVGFGSHAWSGSTHTFQLGVGAGFGAPLNLARGVSYTFVQRVHWPW